ncbi:MULTISPECIES: PEP-CTERM sorting domain-containing protein [Okeania]|uniref:PEP-CTERM sorting domain-containing protein n=1 Tax=Okeania hirsuta TaxID=1458930 RepID=A0A3N6RK35_9CYAN|nr:MULTISPECIES: PEP-CTERM sorting domain-containing protein [Okeania]NES79951.1 PEP-CTERM sorting domain-containing protein [Okeania sp. SIO1H4]NES91125.1 PEP-CTERM sorting domain-containing protein [Okeania sp. SIO2B9]NET20644.1 PEP-CTERM sorting domain-containing protein [Okeania sp. SIO1H5]NET75636.1 PEP-CTERM sorting domain-containing protein [Okeania sp. SIO1F9]NET97520.1 PEP-CTERM sorting domain-containing protein [Okeania sp. SIO1H2]
MLKTLANFSSLAAISTTMLSMVGVPVATAVTTADVIVVVDESGSMYNEHEWLGSMIPDLDEALQNDGVTNNRFGLVGFGSSLSTGYLGRSIPVGGSFFGTSAQFVTATNTLVHPGGFEDGYSAIDFALSNYSFRPGAAVKMILVTDEDRDNGNSSLNFTNILAALQRGSSPDDDILLNTVIDANFIGDALGISSNGKSYTADGMGGFNTTQLPSLSGIVTSSFRNTQMDYVDLALASGGAVWNLNKLRDGGLNATSFSNAFIDIKVEEITQSPEPVPERTSTLALVGLGVLGSMLGLPKQK